MRSCLLATLLVTSVAAPGWAEQRAAAAPEPQLDSTTEPQRTVEFRWNDRPSLSFGDLLRVDFRALLQSGTARSASPSATADDGDDLDKGRVGVEGTLAGILDFEVTRALDDARPWRDVYVDYRQFDAARLQAGRFKLPFSLDENTGNRNLDFVHRSMAASALAPGRDQGVMMHGRIWGRALSYEAGLFAHDGDNARVRHDGSIAAETTAAFRLSTLIGGKSGVHAAVAMTTSDVPATLWTIRGRTTLDDTFFPATLWVQGRRQRFGIESQWTGGPVSLKGEYMRLTQERLEQGVEGNLTPVAASGWYVSGTWVINRGQKSRKRASHATSVFKGGAGAWEAAVRLEALTFGELGAGGSSSPRAATVLGNGDRALTLGLNWYLSPNLKMQTNVIRDALSDPSRGPVPAQASYWSSVVRLQVAM
jgi:phosphate-selective porin OprO/OprP